MLRLQYQWRNFQGQLFIFISPERGLNEDAT